MGKNFYQFSSLVVVFAGLGISVSAQNVGVGIAAPTQKLHVYDATTPNAATIRVSGLSSTSSLALGTAPFQVVMVDANGVMYRGNTVGAPPSAWMTTGNAGTTVASNFMGSTDNVDVAFRTNNTETMRMTNAQRFLVGITAPSAPSTQKMEVYAATGDGLFAHSPNVGAWVGYETNFSFGVPVQNVNGAGVYASNPAAGYTSIYAQSTGAATVAASISYSDVWMASYNYTQNGSATYNARANYNQLNVTNAALAGTKVALQGYNNRGATLGNPGTTVGVQGVGDSDNEDAMGVIGTAFSDAAFAGTGPVFGGYFEGYDAFGFSYAYAYVGGNSGVANRKIIGTGTVSEVVPTPSHGRVTLTAPESPEYWYQDYGTVELVAGTAHVELDPILAEIIVVDATNPLRVFATPLNMLNFEGVTIMNQTTTGFDLVELNGGTHSGTLHYQIVCKPKTNYGEGRFPYAPGPSWVKRDQEPAAAKAANTPDPRSVFIWPSDWMQYGYNPEDMVPAGNIIPAGPNAGKVKQSNGQYTTGIPSDRSSIGQ